MNGEPTNDSSELSKPKIIVRGEKSVTLSLFLLEHEVKLLQQKLKLNSHFTQKTIAVALPNSIWRKGGNYASIDTLAVPVQDSQAWHGGRPRPSLAVFIADRSLLKRPPTIDEKSNPSDFHLSPLPASFLFTNAYFTDTGAARTFFALG